MGVKKLLLPYIIVALFIVGSTFVENTVLQFWLILVGVISFIVLGVWSSIRLSRKVTKLGQHANEIATGNLGESLEVLEKDEFNPIYLSLNNAVNNMRSLVRTLDNGIKKVDVNSDELSATMTELIYIMDDVKETINEMTQGSRELSVTTQQIGVSVEQIEESTKKLAQKANEGKTIAQDG